MTESVVVQLVKAQADLDACRTLLADAWVKVPMRWSKIAAGALVVDDRARLWEVMTTTLEADDLSRFELTVTVRRIGQTTTYDRSPHPDDQVNVLMPVGERDALKLLRSELDAEIIPVADRDQP